MRKILYIESHGECPYYFHDARGCIHSEGPPGKLNPSADIGEECHLENASQPADTDETRCICDSDPYRVCQVHKIAGGSRQTREEFEDQARSEKDI